MERETTVMVSPVCYREVLSLDNRMRKEMTLDYNCIFKKIKFVPSQRMQRNKLQIHNCNSSHLSLIDTAQNDSIASRKHPPYIT